MLKPRSPKLIVNCLWPAACSFIYMQINYTDLTPEEAVDIQKSLRSQIQLTPLTKTIATVAGADISFNKFSDIIYAGIVLLSFPYLQVIDKAAVVDTTTFPYVPGLLAFREVPALLKAWQQLNVKPDVLVLDGHGIAHPRRMGIATHFGVLMKTPTIGCAKSLLTGKFIEPANEPGAHTDLIHQNEVVAQVLRTKKNTKPVFVSPGNLITMQQSIDVILQCAGKYRIPEPTRLAHNFVNETRIAYMNKTEG